MLQRNIRRLFHFKYSFSILKDWQWNMILCFNVNDNLEAMEFWNEKAPYLSLKHSYGLYIISSLERRLFGVSFWALVITFCHVVNAPFCKKYHLVLSSEIEISIKNEAFWNPKRRFKKALFSFERVGNARNIYGSHHICVD